MEKLGQEMGAPMAATTTELMMTLVAHSTYHTREGFKTLKSMRYMKQRSGSSYCCDDHTSRFICLESERAMLERGFEPLRIHLSATRKHSETS